MIAVEPMEIIRIAIGFRCNVQCNYVFGSYKTAGDVQNMCIGDNAR